MCRRGGLLGLTSPFSGTPHQQFCTKPSMDSVSTASEQDEKLENSTTNKEEQFISGHDIVDITANAVLQSVKSSESFDYLLSVQFYQEKINESNQKISLASFQRMAKLLAKESDETAKEEMTEALLNSYDFEKASYFIHENFQNFDWTYKVSLFSCLVGMTDTDILLTKALGNLLKIHLDNNLDVLVAEKLIEVLLRSKRTKMRRLLFDVSPQV